MAVADDKAIAVHVGCNNGMKFRLGACLQTEVVALAVADNLLHHWAHLVDLYREDDKALSFEVILLGCLLKTRSRLLYAAVENVGETQQHGRFGAVSHQVVNEFLEVYLHLVLARSDIYMPLLVYAKEVHSPASDVVELLRVFYSPFCHIANCLLQPFARYGQPVGLSSQNYPTYLR